MSPSFANHFRKIQAPLSSLGSLKTWLLLVFLQGSSAALSQKDTADNIIEGGWIQQMSDEIVLKLALTNSIEAFSVHSNQNKTELHPNTSNLTRIYFNYRIISFFYSYGPKFIPGNDDDDTRGKTRNSGLGISFTFLKSFTDLSYSRTRGYYLENTSDYVPGWVPGDPYIQFPDLVTKSFEGTTGFNFNSRFSLGAIGSQTSRQLKSAGSFIPKLMYRYYVVDDQADSGTTQKSKNFQLILGAGYNYTFVYKKKLYFFAGLSPGFGFIHTKLFTRYPAGDTITRRSRPIFNWDAKTGLGYNGRRFFGGIYLGGSEFRYREKNVAVAFSNVRAAYQVFIGYRFNAPKFLEKTYDDVWNWLMR